MCDMENYEKNGMTQGTLARFLFDWKKHGLKPLEWRQRLMIALDVARGVEYLHCLAQQSFIHRDLKPCNILLGDDMSRGGFTMVPWVPRNPFDSKKMKKISINLV
ncbi:putative protein kinase RLK-Pelle-LRR-IX family [Helianthus anomalus]